VKAAITLDVDSLRLYHDIHGLSGPAPGADPVYTHAMPRFWDALGHDPATLFLIGADAPAYPRAFAPVAETGSEIASHSFSHDYRLSQRDAEAIATDLEQAEAALTPLAGGSRPVGFRAPGYNVSPRLLQILLDRGYRYDSSLLPAPAYFGARAAALAWYRLRGRASRSLRGDPRAFAGPRAPYRTEPARYWRSMPAGRLREIPMAVEPTTRLPLIGTSWVLWPEALRNRLLDRALATGTPFVFELHAIDFLDPGDPGVDPHLCRHQPDLRRRADAKQKALRDLFRRLAAQTDRVTLKELAETVA